MAKQAYEVHLKSAAHFGRHVPPKPVGAILSAIPDLTGRAVRMAFQGTGSVSGRQPAWYTRAADIRFVGMDGKTDTVLHFEAPLLGEAAEELYAQEELWSTRPQPDQTAFDLIGAIVSDVRNQNMDSERFDTSLLNSIYQLRRGFDKDFDSLSIKGEARSETTVLDRSVVEQAKELRSLTPPPRQVRITGVLDMLRASTQTFAIQLQNGETVRGTYLEGNLADLTQHFHRDVTVLGKAVFRASGRLLRIDAEEVLPCVAESGFFSRMPVAVPRKLESGRIVRVSQQNQGIAAVFGKWPGDETDEEIEEALRRIS